jgi:type IV secretory pathway VirB10-like protein
MNNQIDKQQIAQLLTKFMAGETNVAEEQQLAKYFRTHEVDDEWKEYQEMFALFDDGKVDIDADTDSSGLHKTSDSGKLSKLPKAVKEKPKIIALRWYVAGIAASIVTLLVFYFSKGTNEQTQLTAQTTIVENNIAQSQPDTISPQTIDKQPLITQTSPVQSSVQPGSVNTPQNKPKTVDKESLTARDDMMTKPDDTSSTESLADCIARLEAEMDGLDDSVGAEQIERLIAADARLQQMVNRIVGKQVEQAMNEIRNDSTANYISF